MASESQKTQITNLSLAVALARGTQITEDEIRDAFVAGGYKYTDNEVSEVAAAVNQRAFQNN